VTFGCGSLRSQARSDAVSTEKDHPHAVEVKGQRIKLPVIGWVKMREALRFDGGSRAADRWFVRLSVEIERVPSKHHRSNTMQSSNPGFRFRRCQVELSCRWCDPGRRRGRLRQQVCGSFADHAARRLGIAAHQRRHDGSVSNAQLVDATDP
jgi:hypothetical protein